MWPCKLTSRTLCALLLVISSAPALAAGGPIGIDHRLNYDNSGIWKRSTQFGVFGLMVGVETLGALWEGGETRLGRTYWQSIDATLIGAVSTTALKEVFTRTRPGQTDNPNQWFKGSGHYSFPSGEVTAVSAIVTPFVLEYGAEKPAVYALEVLPLYDAIARMKVQAHWQTDVLAGFALGTLSGYYSHNRETPFVLSYMPHGVFVGLRRSW